MLVCDGDGGEIAAVSESLAFRASRCSALGGMKKTPKPQAGDASISGPLHPVAATGEYTRV